MLLAILSSLAGPYIPYELSLELASGSVDNLLNIVATSMLAVTTFSLSIVRDAHTATSNAATPRAVQLLADDSETQNTLGTFVGSFLFSIVGIIALSSELYDEKSRVILFLATLVVIALLVVALLRWIDTLMNFGLLSSTIIRLEDMAKCNLEVWSENPRLCCAAPPLQRSGRALRASQGGHVVAISFEALDDFAKENDTYIDLAVQPGQYVHHGDILAQIRDFDADIEIGHLEEYFQTERTHQFESDPYLAIEALAEVASKALSPAVNDAGTAKHAIEAISRALRVAVATSPDELCSIKHHRVSIAPLDFERLLASFVRPLVRDGNNHHEVIEALERALSATRRGASREAAQAIEKVRSAYLEG